MVCSMHDSCNAGKNNCGSSGSKIVDMEGHTLRAPWLLHSDLKLMAWVAQALSLLIRLIRASLGMVCHGTLYRAVCVPV